MLISIAGMRRCLQLIENIIPRFLFVNTRDTAEAIGARYNL